VIESGRSYLVGDSQDTETFIRRHRSPVPSWLQSACWLAYNEPGKRVDLNSRRLHFSVYRRGEYVNISLPHHDKGGEKDWITMHPFHTRVLVNVD